MSDHIQGQSRTRRLRTSVAIALGTFTVAAALFGTGVNAPIAQAAPSPGYTNETYDPGQALPISELTPCSPTAMDAVAQARLEPGTSGQINILTGDTVVLRGALRICGQAVNTTLAPSAYAYSPPSGGITWAPPTGAPAGTVLVNVPECDQAAGTGCAVPEGTVAYSITATDAAVQSGFYSLRSQAAFPPASMSGAIVTTIDATPSAARQVAILEPRLALTKWVCTLTDPAACDPTNSTLWVKDQLVPQGSSVTWMIEVTNTGNVDLTDIAIATDVTAPALDTTSCVGPTVVTSLATGAELVGGVWNVQPDANGDWPGGESSYRVCTTPIGTNVTGAIVNTAHANANFTETDVNGDPLVNRFTDPSTGQTSRVPSNDDVAQVTVAAAPVVTPTSATPTPGASGMPPTGSNGTPMIIAVAAAFIVAGTAVAVGIRRRKAAK